MIELAKLKLSEFQNCTPLLQAILMDSVNGLSLLKIHTEVSVWQLPKSLQGYQ
jgi:hypothetical protein